MINCEVCTRLTALCDRRQWEHVRATADLDASWGSPSENKRRIAVNDAWLNLQIARREREQHWRTHEKAS